jgi:hypothetical protein
MVEGLSADELQRLTAAPLQFEAKPVTPLKRA